MMKKINYDSNLGYYKIDTMKYYKNIKSYYEVSLNSNYFKQNLKENEKIAKIYFYIKRSKSYISIGSFKECQYSIVEKSSYIKEEILVPWGTRTSVIPLGKSQNFNIEELAKRKFGNINVFFKKGHRNVYIIIPEIPEVYYIRFSSKGNYDYKEETIYSRKIFLFQEKFTIN